MVSSFAVELQFVAGNPNLTFIFFIALTLLTVLSFRFGYYAFRNRQESDLVGEHSLWDYLAFIGLLSVGYSLFGILEIVTTLTLPVGQSLILAVVFLLAATMRVLYRNIIPAATGDKGGADGGHGSLMTGTAVLAVIVVFVGLLVLGRHRAVIAIMGLSALAFAGAGISFGRQGVAETRVQGTVIDTLIRHLLPVLLFSALIPAVELATLVGLDRIIVLHVQVVFVIMTATALMTATIKLRQNLASL